jgi:RND family efflux transporter MFP subunit
MNKSQRIVFAAITAVVVAIAAVVIAGSRPPQATEVVAVQPTSALTVEIETPKRQAWPQQIHANGVLAPWQEVIVSPETGGLRIAELLVDVGSTVRRGQVIARLADETVRTELAKQEALVAQAEASLGKAVADLRRASVVDVAGAISPQRLDEYRATEAASRASLASARADLEATRLRLRQTKILAPDDGVVSSRAGVLGNVVSAGAEVYRLVRQGRVEWQPELDARQLSAIAAGQTAKVQLPDGSSVEGKVRLVAPTLSTGTGRGIAYVRLPPGNGVRPGAFASGLIALEATTALTVHQSAVVLKDGRAYVYILGSGNKVHSQAVTTGRQQGSRIEILSGLEPSQSIVASGGGFLSEGASVTVTSSDKAAR